MRYAKKGTSVITATLLLLFAVIFLPESPAPTAQLDPLDIRPEKAESLSAPQGHPDRFFQYHRDIRASKDGTEEYPVGYRVKEFEKARAAAKTSGTRLNWVERGPRNVGGRTRALLLDPDDPDMDTWWAGSVSGGLWENGRRWKELEAPDRVLSNSVCVLPSYGRE